MSTSGERINYFAETDHRGRKIKFGIKEADRARHMYVIGKTGMGKSTLLENLAVQDIQNGEGICFIDPHGSSAETLLAYVPEHRMNDVVYFAPFDQEFPLALNVMEDIGADKRALVASGLIGSFKKVWVDAWSPRMEYILNNALLALLEAPDSTLLGVNRMFADKAYREYVLTFVKDPSVLAFWKDEFAKYSDKFATEATAAIQNKVGQFAANPLIRNIVGQPKSTFDIRKLMDERKIFIVNLSKGRIGEGNAALIGSMLVTKIYLAAMSRAEVHGSQLAKLPPFYLYVDEFQSFANESFADILSEARKYKLSLTVAHQYIEQMSDEVRAAVFGNVGTMITFRVGSYDAEVLEKEFAPHFLAQDIVNLGFAQIYLKLMINNVGSQPFSATTLPRPEIPAQPLTKEVVESSRRQFGKPRAQVEDDIRKWHEPIEGFGGKDNPDVPKTRKIMPGTRPYEERRSENPIGGQRQRASIQDALIRAQVRTPQGGDLSTAQDRRRDLPQNSAQGVLPRERREDMKPQTVHQPFRALLGEEVVIPKKRDETVKSDEVPVRSAPEVIVPPAQVEKKENIVLPISVRADANSPQMTPRVQLPIPANKQPQIVQKEIPKDPVSLKTLQKRDKGPTPQNLMGLRSALQGVLAKQQDPQKQEKVEVKETGVPVQSHAVAPTGTAPKAPEQVRVPSPASLQTPSVHASSPREAEKYTISSPRPLPTEEKVSPSEYKQERQQVPPKMESPRELSARYGGGHSEVLPEIPEDVLRRVLELD